MSIACEHFICFYRAFAAGQVHGGLSVCRQGIDEAPGQFDLVAAGKERRISLQRIEE